MRIGSTVRKLKWCCRCDRNALSIFIFCASLALYCGSLKAQTATHQSDAYVPGQNLDVQGSFSYDAEDELLGLAWILDLPVGWSVTNVIGDGGPELDADESTIVFTDSNLTNPVNFTITLDVPSGTTNAQSLSATAEYWFQSMVDEAEIPVNPDPLAILRDPEVTAWPLASPIVYGDSLGESDLTNGAALADGSFDFANSALTPDAGTNAFMVVFEPTDSANYASVSNTVDVEVTRKALTVTGSFTVADKLYDGGMVATIETNNLALQNVVEGEESLVSLSPAAEFASSEIGHWTVSLVESSELEGSGNDNYTLSLAGAPETNAYILPFFADPNEVPGRWYIDSGLEPGAEQNWDDVPFNDDDEDGMLNWEEYVSGTDPKDITSLLHIVNSSISYGTNYTERVYGGEESSYTQRVYEVLGYAVEWPSVSGRWYRIDWTPSVETGSWQLLSGAEDLSANPPLNTYTDTTSTAEIRFYRIRATME